MISLVIALVFAVIHVITGMMLADGYTLTQNDTDEARILAICIESDIYLDFCNQIYAGKNYGDKIE